MRKNLVLLMGGAAVIVAAGYLFYGGGGGSDELVVSTGCVSLCAGAEDACPASVDEEKCLAECGGFSEETKAHLAGADTCEELMAKPELVSELVMGEGGEAEAGGTEAAGKRETSQDCQAACNHYVVACLTLVPTADAVLFEEGFDSCLGQCAGWDAAKTGCMIGAMNCEAMTEQCGL